MAKKELRHPVDARIRQRLVAHRQSRRMSQDAIGERLNTTGSTVSYIESGQRPITLIRFLQMCDIYNISPSELLDDVLEVEAGNKPRMELEQEIKTLRQLISNIHRLTYPAPVYVEHSPSRLQPVLLRERR